MIRALNGFKQQQGALFNQLSFTGRKLGTRGKDGRLLSFRLYNSSRVCCGSDANNSGDSIMGRREVMDRYIGQPSPWTHPHLLQENEITPGMRWQEYAIRRTRLLEALPEKSTAIVISNPLVTMSADIPFSFRQHTDFFYLTGFLEPDSVLVLHKDGSGKTESLLFVQPRDQTREMWDGIRTGVEGAIKFIGVDKSMENTQIKSGLADILDRSKFVFYGGVANRQADGDGSPAHPKFHKLVSEVIENVDQSKLNSSEGLRRQPLDLSLQSMRLIKSKAEIMALKKACEIGSEAFKDVMKSCRPKYRKSLLPHYTEHELYIEIEHAMRRRGAQRLSFPPVIAGGARANTLHYISNDQVLEEDELVLVDCGCESWGYCSDITRTFPVSGKFTKGQADVYQKVLDVNKACIEACRTAMSAGSKMKLSLNNLHDISFRFTLDALLELGIKKPENMSDRAFVSKYYPHHISHYLGMDTHDTNMIDRNIPMAPGMALTVEPGIYIKKDDEYAPEEYRGVAIRIEDNVALLDGSIMVLTESCPKEIIDIESLG
eukprot:Nk52_evm5s328 gene=Nk52_evmTU5s328